MLYILNKSPEGTNTNNEFIPLSGLANSSVLLSFLFGRKLLKTHKAAEPLHMNNILHYYEQFYSAATVQKCFQKDRKPSGQIVMSLHYSFVSRSKL